MIIHRFNKRRSGQRNNIAKNEKYLGVTILVNNTGIIKRIPIREVSEFKEVILIDLVILFIVAKHCIPQMIIKDH